MPIPARLLVSPFPATEPGRVPASHAAALVAADVLRRAAGEGPTPTVGMCMEPGSLVGQHSTERMLTREGHDRSSLGRDDFVARTRAMEDDTRAALRALTAVLDVPAVWPASTAAGGVTSLAARTAFVRLYEDGLLEDAERVVPACARCATVVGDTDVSVAGHEADLVTLRVPTDRGLAVEVATFALEFLPGVVAVGVPDGHPLAGARAVVPLTGLSVPIIGDEGVLEVSFLVPAHDAEAWAVARGHGLLPIPVLDAAGVVRAEGQLFGLGRFAARAAARDRLSATGSVVKVERAEESAPRCRDCGSALVPVIGRHWVLAERRLRRAAADAVREGAIRFTPATVRDEFVAAAGEPGDWVLSRDLWAGTPVPAAHCLDCASVTVSVESPPSCPQCFGALESDRRTLDSRFMAAVWLLAATGWPHYEDGPWQTAHDTALVAIPDHVASWVVPAAALGRHLTGVIPFSHVTVHEGPPETLPELGDGDRQAARLWLAGAAPDLAAAHGLIEGLSRPDVSGGGAVDVEGLTASMLDALDDLSVQGAALSLASVLARGVPAAAAARLRRVAAVITGG